MKKVILGSAMFMTGLLSAAIILAGTMSNEWTLNGEVSAFWNMSQYGLVPVFCIFIGIACVGMVVAVWGLLGSKEQ